jgi:Tfp pilus assembly protein PilF
MHITRQSAPPSIFASVIIMLIISLFLHGCGGSQRVSTPDAEVSPPTEYKAVTGPAAALYTKAEDAMRSGQYASSEMLLERALRIEPHNPHYWHTMALVKYRQEKYSQTVQFCLKADSLAGNHPRLTARNRELLEQARQAMNNR